MLLEDAIKDDRMNTDEEDAIKDVETDEENVRRSVAFTVRKGMLLEDWEALMATNDARAKLKVTDDRMHVLQVTLGTNAEIITRQISEQLGYTVHSQAVMEREKDASYRPARSDMVH
jgi:hypothetical protein